MKVILTSDVKGTGKKGQIINVSDGFARNCLFPKNLAVSADTTHVKELNEKNEATKRKASKLLQEAIDKKAELEGTTITVKVKCGENGKLFGSVTSKDIANSLTEQGYEIDKKMVLLKDPIKKTGREMIDIKLHTKVIARVNVVLEP